MSAMLSKLGICRDVSQTRRTTNRVSSLDTVKEVEHLLRVAKRKAAETLELRETAEQQPFRPAVALEA